MMVIDDRHSGLMMLLLAGVSKTSTQLVEEHKSSRKIH